MKKSGAATAPGAEPSGTSSVDGSGEAGGGKVAGAPAPKATSKLRSDWDPLAPGTPSPQRGSRQCIKRVMRDIRELTRHPLPGVMAVVDDADLLQVHALVVGPSDTPYEGGMFHFFVRLGPDYPHTPPQCRFMTTGGGT